MRGLLLRLALACAPLEFRNEYASQLWEDYGDLRADALARWRMACSVAASGAMLRVEGAARNVRNAGRSLARAPLFATVCIGTLALAVSVNVSAYSAIDAVLLHPLPFVDAERLAFVAGDTDLSGTIPGPEIVLYRARSHAFESIATYEYLELTLTGAGRARTIKTERVSSNLFDVARAQPQLGRFFTAADERSGRAVVLSDGMWRTLFGGRADALGRTVHIDGISYGVVGVAKRDFAMPDHRAAFAFSPSIAAWICAPAADFSRAGRPRRMYALGRLKPGLSAEAAQAELAPLAARMAAADPAMYKGIGVGVVPVEQAYLGGTRTVLLVTFAAVALILLIACANVANLLLVRGAARAHEAGLRSALGALRRTLAAEYLSEVTVISVAGAVLGTLLAALQLRAIRSVAPADVPRLAAAGIDARVLGFVALLIAACMAAAGIVPVLAGSRRRLAGLLGGGGRSGAAVGSTARARVALAVTQIALAFVVLTTSSLLTRSWYVLMHTSVGFAPDGAYAGYMLLGSRRYADPAAIRSFVDRALERVAAAPGVSEVAAALNVPCTRGAVYSTYYHIAGQPISPNPVAASLNFVTPRYFSTMRIPLLRGRAFDAGDRAGTRPVAVISDVLARREFGDADPIGKRVLFDPADPKYPPRTIVGVVGAVRGRLDGRLQRTLYVPFAQVPIGVFQIVIRAGANAKGLERAVPDAIAPIDPNQAPPEVVSLRDSVDSWARTQRINATLFAMLAAVALALAFAGIYGVVAQAAVQRTQEFGIRMALGAPRRAILRGVVGEALRVGVLGAALGLVLSAFAVRAVRDLLFGVSPFDPAALGAAAAALVACALVSAVIPARRATGLNPVAALRYE